MSLPHPLRRLRHVALVAQFPRVHPAPPFGSDLTLLDALPEEQQTIAAVSTEYPDLAADLRVAQEVVVPHFRACDEQANVEQNRHRRQQVLLILGGFLTATLGSVQAVLRDAVWPGIAVAAVAAATGAIASVARQSAALDRYLDQRVRAERLRALYFAFLAGPAPDLAPTTRVRALREQAATIRFGRR